MNGRQSTKDFPTNKVLQTFGPLIGSWNTVGTHGMIPNKTLHGRTTFAWHESGVFIRMESAIKEDVGIPAAVAFIGSDDSLGTYEMVYYDERGVSRTYHMSIEGTVLKWWRDEPGFLQRTTLTITDDGKTMTGKGEICQDGSTWQQDLDLTYSLVESV